MNPKVQSVIYQLLEKIFNKTGDKHDAHYEQGKGVLIVPHGFSLEHRVVLASISEQQLMLMTLTGVPEINIK